MRARSKRLKLVELWYVVERDGGVNGVLLLGEGIRFASVGFDGSLGC